MTRILLLLAALLFPAFALAADGYCSGAIEIGENNPIRLMRVVSNEARVSLVEQKSDRKPKCPSNAEACKRKGFLVPGDEVLAAPVTNGFVCITYISPNAKRVKDVFPETGGFLPATAVQEVPGSAPKPADWLGTWSRNAEAEVEITNGTAGKLKVAGSATFGAFDPGRVRRGGVNTGEIEGEAAPKGNALAIGEGYADGTKQFPTDADACQARLRLYGRYLVVEDNRQCGGMNVSFFGTYIRLR